MQLEGKVALVTGGARGLGRSMALAYAREGADVAIVARTDSELDTVGSEIRALGRRAHTVNAELTTIEGANRAARETISELGKIDILVNNVGGYRLFTNDLTHAVTVLDITEEEWRRVMESNLTTTFMACKAVLPHMIERRSGVIVNLTSKNVARQGRAGQASYGAAKAAVERLSESLADEVKDFGIAVNILDPGWNLTKPNDDYDDEVHKRMRLPDDIAEVAVYMAMQTPEDHDRPVGLRLGIRRGARDKTAFSLRPAPRLASVRAASSRRSLPKDPASRLGGWWRRPWVRLPQRGWCVRGPSDPRRG